MGIIFLFSGHMLAKPHHLGVNRPTTLCKNKDFALPSFSNPIIGTTSYYCIILKMVILHDAIKTIQNGAFPFSLKKSKILLLFKKSKKIVF